MQDSKYAQKLFQENKFEEAIRLFSELLKTANGVDQKVKLYSFLINAYSYLDREDDLQEVKQQYSSFLFENELYDQFTRLTEDLLATMGTKGKSLFDKNSYKLWKSYVLCGQIFKAENITESILKYYYQRKNVRFSINFLDELLASGCDTSNYDEYYLKNLLLISDIDGASKFLSNIIDDYIISLNSSLVCKSYSCRYDIDFIVDIVNLIDSNVENWKKYPEIFDIKIMYMIRLLDDECSISLKNNILKQIYEYVVIFPELHMPYFWGLVYGHYFTNKTICEKFKNCLFNLNIVEKGIIAGVVETILLKIKDFDAVDDIYEKVLNIEDSLVYDMGDDLFEDRTSQFDDVNNHPGLVYGDNNELKDIRLVEDELLKEISKYTLNIDRGISSREEGISERGLLNTLNLTDIGTISSYYRDLVVACISMEFYNAAIFIFKKIEKNSAVPEQLNENISYNYLKASTFYEAGCFYESLAILEESIACLPLLEKEEVDFIYLMGEVFLKLKDFDKALNAFLTVKKINSSYRMVEMKVNEINKNK